MNLSLDNYLCILQQQLIDVSGAELGQFAVVTKDDNSNLGICEGGQLICLLEQTRFAFEVRDLAIAALCVRCQREEL